MVERKSIDRKDIGETHKHGDRDYSPYDPARRFSKAVSKIVGTGTRTLRRESSPDTPLQTQSSLSVGKKRKGRTHQAVALELTIESARHFPKMDVMGSCDAYCQVQWMNKDFRTAIIKNSMNPDWHDVCGR